MTQDISYLGRRIRFLIDQLQQGKVHFVEPFASSESGQRLIDDLEQVREHPNGYIDTSTCSPLVKIVAKALYATMPLSEPNEPQQKLAPTAGQISNAMRHYFAMLDGFFLDATGESASGFSQVGYKAKITKAPPYWANRFGRAMETHLPRISRFHGQNSHLLLGSRSTIGGLKYVLGGSSRFPDAALGGVRKAALYADTIYVPDPLLPWIEIDRVEERFRHMELLLAYQTLLQLKPLVDAQLSYPAVIVFPSWEKSLETCDTVTQDGIAKLTLEVILKMGTLRRTERCGSHGPNGCTVGGG